LPPQQKQVVQTALFAPESFLLVGTELLIAHRFERLPGPPRLVKEFPLLIAYLLQAGQLLFQFPPVAQQFRIAQQSEMNLDRGHPCAQPRSLLPEKFQPPGIHLLNQMPHPRHLLVSGAQPQLLLVFQAFTKMEYGLQWKMECHDLANVFERSLHPGNASNR
jgi:hypothetical protein